MQPKSEFAAHTDYLHVTVPYDRAEGLERELLARCEDGTVSERQGVPGVFDLYDKRGTMLLRQRGDVVVVGFSGGAIEGMRAGGVWWSVLGVLGMRPHRVTLIDAAYDRALDAPPVLEEIFQRHKLDGVRFGQRAAVVSKTGWKVGISGAETGTIYIGTRKSEVRARVYDKRQERIDNGYPDPGPRIRYELTVTAKGAGISLHDALDPTRLFWSFIGGRLLERPENMPAWEPRGVGFELAGREPMPPFEALVRYLDKNPNWARLMAMADACGPKGRRWLVGQLEFWSSAERGAMIRAAYAKAKGLRKAEGDG